MGIDLNQILGSLTPEDISSLKSAAAGLMGNLSPSGDEARAESAGAQPPRKSEPQLSELLSGITAGGTGLPDISKLASLAPVLPAIEKKDERTDFLAALKPLLSEERRHKADEAAKLLRLMSLLPVLREQGIL